jgi:serine protease Do
VGGTLLLLALLAAANAPELRASNRRTAVVAAIAEAEPSIVNIHGRKTVRDAAPSLGSDGFKQVNGMGTGIVIDPRGYVLTNYHVVEGVTNIQVALHDQRTAVAKLVAHDRKCDLAVIKIDVDGPLPIIKMGTSSDLMKGEQVIAIGNAYGYEHTVSRGIISALHRNVPVSDDQKYQDLIQTDAAINPGNSGGPLINIDGEVIGINVAVRVGAQGIAFAIPIDDAVEIAARLMSVERLEGFSHGISGQTRYSPDCRTFTVLSVKKDTLADRSGLKPGDVLVAIGDRKVERNLDIELALLGRKPGEELPFEVQRAGAAQKLVAALPSTNSVKPVGRITTVDRTWNSLGLRLEPIAKEDFQDHNTKYKGGLRVTAVRSGSQAAEQGIRRGDVLVGMHVWQTVSLENINYILDREDLDNINPLVFYILRDGDTFFGHIRIASRKD